LRLLLDTHALIWWLAGDDRLPPAAREAIADDANDVFVSAVSAMEVTTKHRLGKLPDADMLAQDFTAIVADQGFTELPISLAHAAQAGAMTGAHRDPFDRLLIAQALREDLLLVSNEILFEAFGVRRLW
jgi:PIN domain nuclease of toxin-antitoxin system